MYDINNFINQNIRGWGKSTCDYEFTLYRCTYLNFSLNFFSYIFQFYGKQHEKPHYNNIITIITIPKLHHILLFKLNTL